MADGVTFVGKRVICDDFIGTVKYFGVVPPTQGEWLGVEWDDEKRGKHDGTLDGVSYFVCSHPKSGSFVRLKKVNFGVSVIDALKQRYGVKHDTVQDMYVVDANNKKTAVEMVGVNDVHKVQSCFEKLVEVGLREQLVNGPDKDVSLSSVAPNIVQLDISRNLIASWDDLAKVIKDLNKLKTLNVSENQLTLPTDHSLLKSSFCMIKELYLNRMNLSWTEVLMIMTMFPDLEDLHVCYNAIDSLRLNNDEENSNQCLLNQKIVTLNLEGNLISNWSDITLLGNLTRLKTLILNDNKLIDVIFDDDTGSNKTNLFPSLTSLSFSRNSIKDITSVNALNKLVDLVELRFKDNPVFKGETGFSIRQELIARISSVKTVNGSPVTEKERLAAERAYIKKYAKDWFDAGGKVDNYDANKLTTEFVEKHPRYAELARVHGIPDSEVHQKTAATLKESLIALTFKCPDDSSKKVLTKKLPGTMTIGKLKGLLYRLYKVDSADQKLSYLDTKNDREIQLDDDLRSLSFYSVVQGDTLYVRW
ncbi:tubulin-specific chaperone E-like [Actinia tenebrosa]|uniref:Tubulin-specific chaperone E n=1 Tax=Actinia tenebrosa TaxID=6105 RepID=A0A6P8HBJ0_ACTTE|nr:tubulin-specific chaperone E-like [Actinia tenebrosa]